MIFKIIYTSNIIVQCSLFFIWFFNFLQILMNATLFPALTEEVVSMVKIHTHAFVLPDTMETIAKSVRILYIEDIPAYYYYQI